MEYHPELQILFIWTGKKSAVGKEIAAGIIVHYDKDKPDEQCSAVAIRIDSAEYVLNLFVDAILARYGVKREEEPAASQAQD